MSTTDAESPAPVKLPNARHALVPGLVAAGLGAALSGIANYAILGMPDSQAQNLLHQGVSGLVTGAIGGYLGVRMHMRKASAATPPPA